MAEELSPVVVVTDEKLAAGQGGVILARDLKRAARMRDLPIVILTSYRQTRRVAGAEAEHALFLVEPCRPDVLSNTVIGLIRRPRAHAR
jgi:DNA-binding response OmpR family regulator